MKQSDLKSQFPKTWANTPDAGTLSPVPEKYEGSGNLSLEKGIPKENMTPLAAGGAPPKGDQFNGILQMLSVSAQGREAGSAPAWNKDFSTAIGGYPKTAKVTVVTDGVPDILVSTVDNNINDPSDPEDTSWISIKSGLLLASDAKKTYQPLGDYITNDQFISDVFISNIEGYYAWFSYTFKVPFEKIKGVLATPKTEDGEISSDNQKPWKSSVFNITNTGFDMCTDSASGLQSAISLLAYGTLPVSKENVLEVEKIHFKACLGKGDINGNRPLYGYWAVNLLTEDEIENLPQGMIALPDLKTMQDLAAFKAKNPYIDKDGNIKTGYQAPPLSPQEQAQKDFALYTSECTKMYALGLKPSSSSVAYGKSLYEIINQKDGSISKQQNVLTLPTPPSGKIDDPSSSWWSQN